MLWEVEQKFRIDDMRAIESKLAELNARIETPIRQVVRYFNHPQRDFGESDEALRLRQVSDDNFITYKGPKIDPTTKTRRELELSLPHGQHVPEEFAELLQALGFREVATVKKIRRTAHVPWEGHQIEIALDDVLELGSFVELETTADDESLNAAKTALATLAKRLEIVMSERRSYLEQLLTVTHNRPRT